MIRVFGSDTCIQCNELCKSLKIAHIDYVFVDANADKNQDLCDSRGVNAIPHVEILENEIVIWQQSQIVTFSDILNALKK